jgi:hypothetical protein
MMKHFRLFTFSNRDLENTAVEVEGLLKKVFDAVT